MGSVLFQESSKRNRDSTGLESSNLRMDIKRVRVEGETQAGPRPVALITRALSAISSRMLAPTVVRGRNLIPDPPPNQVAVSSSSHLKGTVNNHFSVSDSRVGDGKRNDEAKGNRGGNRGDIISDFVKVKTNNDKSRGFDNGNDNDSNMKGNMKNKNRKNNQNDGNGNGNGNRSDNTKREGQGQGQGQGQRQKGEPLNFGNGSNSYGNQRRGGKGGGGGGGNGGR